MVRIVDIRNTKTYSVDNILQVSVVKHLLFLVC